MPAGTRLRRLGGGAARGNESLGRPPLYGPPTSRRRAARINVHALVAVAAFFLALALLPDRLGQYSRAIAAWDVGAVSFLGLTWLDVIRSTPDTVRRRARCDGTGRWMLLVLTVGTACVSLMTTALSLRETRDLRGDATLGPLALVTATILLAWGVMQTAFTLHYAHIYYGEGPGGGDRGGFAFPDERQPDYLDFFYASTVIGMTNQVSDVACTSRAMRRAVAAHGILSFFFNTVVLALTVNMIAGSL